MKWLAEQKVIVEVEAGLEDEAREIIKKNTLSCNNKDIKVIRQGQQSWMVPKDAYFMSRFGISD